MSNIDFSEYGERMPGCIRHTAPKCNIAVIPAVVVDNINGLKGLSDCFVHVNNINTTFYIDDRARSLITWAGPIESDGYDYVNNPLKVRSQVVYDFENNRAIYYNKTGQYRLIDLTEV